MAQLGEDYANKVFNKPHKKCVQDDVLDINIDLDV